MTNNNNPPSVREEELKAALNRAGNPQNKRTKPQGIAGIATKITCLTDFSLPKILNEVGEKTGTGNKNSERYPDNKISLPKLPKLK